MWLAPSALARSSLASLLEVTIVRRAEHHAELKCKDGNAAGSLHQHGLAGLQAALADQGLPGGERGAGQRRGLLVGQVLGRVHQPLLIEAHILGKHSVDVAAELPDARGLVEIAAEPALPEGAEHPVADLGPRHALADGDDHADAVRGRHKGEREFEGVGASDHVGVAVVERHCAGADHHVAETRFRHRPINQFEMVEAELAVDHDRLHRRPPQRGASIEPHIAAKVKARAGAARFVIENAPAAARASPFRLIS